jgi:hypothetical protein
MSAGFTSVSSSLFLTGVFGVVKLLSAIAFMFVFVKIRGNRFWLLLGSSLCGICMLVLGIHNSSIPPTTQNSADEPQSLLRPQNPTSKQPRRSKAHPRRCGLSPHRLHLRLLILRLAWPNIMECLQRSPSLPPFLPTSSVQSMADTCTAQIFPLHINAKCCAITTCTQWLFQVRTRLFSFGEVARIRGRYRLTKKTDRNSLHNTTSPHNNRLGNLSPLRNILPPNHHLRPLFRS